MEPRAAGRSSYHFYKMGGRTGMSCAALATKAARGNSSDRRTKNVSVDSSDEPTYVDTEATGGKLDGNHAESPISGSIFAPPASPTAAATASAATDATDATDADAAADADARGQLKGQFLAVLCTWWWCITTWMAALLRAHRRLYGGMLRAVLFNLGCAALTVAGLLSSLRELLLSKVRALLGWMVCLMYPKSKLTEPRSQTRRSRRWTSRGTSCAAAPTLSRSQSERVAHAARCPSQTLRFMYVWMPLALESGHSSSSPLGQAGWWASWRIRGEHACESAPLDRTG